MPELATKADLLAVKRELLTEICMAGFRSEIRSSMAELRSDLHNSSEILTLQLTLRLGVMLALAFWAVVIIVKRV